VIAQRHRRRCELMSGALRRLWRGEKLSPRAQGLAAFHARTLLVGAGGGATTTTRPLAAARLPD